MYDFLIVGSGFFGSVCARELTDLGYKCLVIDKRDHIGGNCYTENIEGIDVHRYGAHIFHTSKKETWV
jgi:UDP-galactopyranose mutase